VIIRFTNRNFLSGDKKPSDLYGYPRGIQKYFAIFWREIL